MTPNEVERILADFRGWLETHGRKASSERVDFKAIVGHFTALRHEVNMQTKASRTLSEQTGKLLESVELAGTPKPVVKAFLDIADVLSVSRKQMVKLREKVEPLLEQLAGEALPMVPKAGFFTRSWQRWADEVQEQHEARNEACAAAAETLLDLAQAAADGYAMTLRRVDRALPELELEAIECVGKPFDPETMEVVEVGGEGAAGIVAEEVRRGYFCKGSLLRCAQVRVAR